MLEGIRFIVDPIGQADPTFRSTRLYTPLTVKEIRSRFVAQKGHESKGLLNEVYRNNQAADQERRNLCVSLDTKAVLKVGPFSRGGYSRQGEKACDHDFQPKTTLTPFGILLPQTGDNHL